MRSFLLAALIIAGAGLVHAQTIHLDTSSLSEWEPLDFPKIKRHSTFEIVTEDDLSAIRVDSDESASALVYEAAFNLEETPILKWSWKAMNVLAAGNAETKKGDDYPIRMYVMFPYEASRVPFFQRIQFTVAKTLYGQYPPAEVLNYVWANRPQDRQPVPNAYTNRAMMFFLDTGEEFLGEWRTHTVNIPEDYRKAFNREPPDTFQVAIMGDSDNTGGMTTAFIRDVSLAPVF